MLRDGSEVMLSELDVANQSVHTDAVQSIVTDLEAIQVELGKRIEGLIIDPNYWNLAKYTVVEGYHNDMNAITIYPNPTQDIMNIYAKDIKVDRVEIINVVGEVISTHQIRSIKSSSIPLDVSQLSQGMYFVRITAEGNHTTTKLMKD